MTSSGQDRIPVGYVRRAHGIYGDVLVRRTVQDAEERFVTGAVLVTDEDAPRRLEISTARDHQGDFIVGFLGIDDRDTANVLRGVQFLIDRSERRELGTGEFWPEDLVGFTVLGVEGNTVGVVVAVITGESQDRLVIEQPSDSDGSDEADGSNRRGEVPFVEALVPRVDIEERVVVVDLPEGLIA